MLPILGDVLHPSACRCDRCAESSPALWLIEAAVLEMNPSVTARKLMATATGYTIDDDPFIKVELMLAATLATAFGAAAEEAERLLKEAFRYRPLDRHRIDDALEQANLLLGNVIDDQTLIRIEEYVDQLITDGALDAVNAERPHASEIKPPEPPKPDNHHDLLVAGVLAGGAILTRAVAKNTILQGVPSTQLVYSGMVAAAKYYTNNHFNTVIMPELQKRIENLFNSATTIQPDPTDIIEYIGRRLKSVPYWRVVANAAASRAYHYGAMKAGEMLGVRAYQIQAVLDERTSAICQYMNGKEFWLSDAVRLLETAAMGSFEDVKTVTPWLKLNDIVGADAGELSDLGFMVPPFHPNCRSTIIFIYDS
jgi:hypothetical protein